MVFNRLHVACIIFMLSLAGSLQAAEYLVFYLGGQSNMDGYGYVKQLPAELAGEVEGVMIFHGNRAKDGVAPDGRGCLSPLQPVYCFVFLSDGTSN